MPKPPSREALAVMAAWPGNEWYTADQLAAHLAGQGVDLGERTLVPILNEARRRSWLSRDQRHAPAVYRRTKTGEYVELKRVVGIFRGPRHDPYEMPVDACT